MGAKSGDSFIPPLACSFTLSSLCIVSVCLPPLDQHTTIHLTAFIGFIKYYQDMIPTGTGFVSVFFISASLKVLSSNKSKHMNIDGP